MNSAVNVWTAPDGETHAIPDDVYAQTKFNKTGLPDKRIKSNAAFYAWLESLGCASPGANTSAAQAYAQRIWDGQSTSLPTKERLARVERGLQAQGLSMEGVTLL